MAQIKIFALGGLGENGKNMYVVEVNNRIFILDAGIKYPDIDMYGVDAVIPNINYLINNKDRIEGIFITHGHEDHINALPYLLKQIPIKVFGTHFTISLIENLLNENKMNVKRYKLYRINENKVLTFGQTQVSFFNTSHSIPESVGIAIHTDDGPIVYCTDFNFGPTSFGKYQTSYSKITDLSKYKVLALLSESISAGTINRIKNDSLFEHELRNILINAKGRIIISAYSSDLSRIQKIINLAVEKEKKIAIVGRKTEKIIDVVIKTKYLDIPKTNFVSISPFDKEDRGQFDKDLVVIVAGIRNEPFKMLVRMALGEDKLIKIGEHDTTIVACPPIPGNEKVSIDALNTLYRYNINAHIFGKNILRSSHADKEDLKLLYKMLKPKYIVPVKGEHRHMYEQYLVAKDAGYEQDNILMLNNGDVAVFENGLFVETLGVEEGDIFVDGSLLASVDEQVIKNRETLAEEGAVILTINYDIRKRKVTSHQPLITKGVAVNIPIEGFSSSVSDLAIKIVNNSLVKKKFEINDVENTLKEEIGKLVHRLIRHRPIIIVNLVEISK